MCGNCGKVKEKDCMCDEFYTHNKTSSKLPTGDKEEKSKVRSVMGNNPL